MRRKKRIANACGSLLADYAYLPAIWDGSVEGPTFAVEIKPKQGWIAKSERIYPICIYCLNQYIKFENNEIRDFSNYCPMDLFSGSRSRMTKAIKNLLNSPQNNIKIFKDGSVMYDENCSSLTKNKVLCDMFRFSGNCSAQSSINEFSDLIVRILLSGMYIKNNCSDPGHTYHETIRNNSIINHFPSRISRSKLCNFNRESLPPGCVLDRILKLQELDQWGSEQIGTTLVEMQEEKKELSIYEEKKSETNCAKCHFSRSSSEKSNKLTEKEVMLKQYMMAAVAKDCSLMITFKRISFNRCTIPEENIISTTNGYQYAFQIGVFDLYPKKLSSIAKHIRKRKKFAHTFGTICNGYHYPM